MSKTLIVALCLLLTCVSAGNWTIQRQDLAAILSGVSFVDSQHGWLAGAANNVGAEALYTTDGGTNWKRASEGGSTLMFLDIAMNSKTSGVVAGLGVLIITGMEYTTNGTGFNPAKEFELESESQSVEGIVGDATGYGVTGQFGESNGVAISVNGGQVFKMIDCGLNNETYLTRYGAFPSPTTWFLSAGTWGDNSQDRKMLKQQGIKRLTERISLVTDSVTGQVTPKFDFKPAKKQPKGDNNGYYCAISRTTDGGNTWSQVFNNVNNYYPNSISCPTVTDCWFVAESGGTGTGMPGARIFATNDGGQTWTQQWSSSNPAYSLMAINMISATEGWAAGGQLDASFDGEWLHTSNGGQTWTATTLQGVYGNDLSFVTTGRSSYVGWATAFTEESLSSVIQYK